MPVVIHSQKRKKWLGIACRSSARCAWQRCRKIVTDAIDWIAFAQGETAGFIRGGWGYPLWLCVLATGGFLLVDATLFAAAMHKVA